MEETRAAFFMTFSVSLSARMKLVDEKLVIFMGILLLIARQSLR